MLLSGDDLLTYRKLFNKASRDQKDWSILKELLFSADLVYGRKDEGDLHGLVTYGIYAPTFTTMEAAEKFFEGKYELGTDSFRSLGLFLDERGGTLLIDAKPGGRGIRYSNGRIDACFIGFSLLS